MGDTVGVGTGLQLRDNDRKFDLFESGSISFETEQCTGKRLTLGKAAPAARARAQHAAFVAAPQGLAGGCRHPMIKQRPLAADRKVLAVTGERAEPLANGVVMLAAEPADTSTQAQRGSGLSISSWTRTREVEVFMRRAFLRRGEKNLTQANAAP